MLHYKLIFFFNNKSNKENSQRLKLTEFFITLISLKTKVINKKVSNFLSLK